MEEHTGPADIPPIILTAVSVYGAGLSQNFSLARLEKLAKLSVGKSVGPGIGTILQARVKDGKHLCLTLTCYDATIMEDIVRSTQNKSVTFST